MLCARLFTAPVDLATTSWSRSRAPSVSPIWRNSSASSSLRDSGSSSASGADSPLSPKPETGATHVVAQFSYFPGVLVVKVRTSWARFALLANRLKNGMFGLPSTCTYA